MHLTDHDTAAELSATAADIAANLAEGRACPDLIDHARDMLYTLTDEFGEVPEDGPVRRGWLPARVLAYARARRALAASDAFDLPLPVALTPKGLAALAGDTQ